MRLGARLEKDLDRMVNGGLSTSPGLPDPERQRPRAGGASFSGRGISGNRVLTQTAGPALQLGDGLVRAGCPDRVLAE